MPVDDPYSISAESLIADVEVLRIRATSQLSEARRSEFGQFLTPPRVAELTARLFTPGTTDVHLLEAGAGVGSLIAAALVRLLQTKPPKRFQVTAYEIDPDLRPFLERALSLCGALCCKNHVEFHGVVLGEDFVPAAAALLENSLFPVPTVRFTHAILNPPYRKITQGSEWHRVLVRMGLGSTNIYTAFLELASNLLADGGQLAAIVPRSFCNGTYFRPFRERFLGLMALRHVHSFASRNQAFKGDAVLQENVILHAVRSSQPPDTVQLVLSEDPDDAAPTTRTVPFVQVVYPSDAECFIHLVSDEIGQAIARQVRSLPETLATLGLTVSTGPVVEFRLKRHLRTDPADDAVPLLYPGHLSGGRTRWPKPGKKPNAIALNHESRPWLVPDETYVVIKRFSAKEERRRVVAAVHSPCSIPGKKPFEALGIENHLNFLHRKHRGLEFDFACGLSAFLNSTHLDEFFRQFSGHTQVNAGDLRKLPFPKREDLEELGRRIGQALPEQEVIDTAITEVLFATMENESAPLEAMQKVSQAQEILRALGLPRPQQNERSAYSLLALLNLLPATPWAAAENPLCGTHGMMKFFRVHYGKDYAANSRETIRRETLHQFRDAGLVVVNPDRPTRPINSMYTVYQVNPELLIVLRKFGTKSWPPALKGYLAKASTLAEKYAQARQEKRIAVTLPDGQKFTLSPGGQNPLVAALLGKFLPQFARKPKVLYVGDTDTKWVMVDKPALEKLGISFDSHGKFPDLIALDCERHWLLLFEAVTSHGPINPKRHSELKALFGKSSAPLVFVTAFADRRTLAKYLSEIAWETEVWVADSPTHLIHLNGERFLGPYKDAASGG